MFLVKIHVLDSVEKCSDYRGEKRGLASLHASVSWGIKLLAFLLFLLERGCCQIIIILLLLSKSAVCQRSIQTFLRIDFQGKKVKHFLSIKTFIQRESFKTKLNTRLVNLNNLS